MELREWFATFLFVQVLGAGREGWRYGACCGDWGCCCLFWGHSKWCSGVTPDSHWGITPGSSWRTVGNARIELRWGICNALPFIPALTSRNFSVAFHSFIPSLIWPTLGWATWRQGANPYPQQTASMWSLWQMGVQEEGLGEDVLGVESLGRRKHLAGQK